MVTLSHIALLVALAALAYTFAGYPLLLAAWVRLAPRPVRRAAFRPAVAIVVVVHNGAGVIARKVRTCLEQDYSAEKLRVLGVSDDTDARQPLDRRAVRHLVANRGDAEVAAVSGQLVFERDGMTAFGEGSTRTGATSMVPRRSESTSIRPSRPP
jgi:hypothetical protein